MFQLDHITYSYNSDNPTPLLDDIMLHIPKNALLAIMGLNGTGKTTLLKILSRVIQPHSGTLTIDGQDALGFTHKDLAQKISFVPQDFPTDFPFTVLDFVMMGRFAWQDGLFNTKADRDKVEATLSQLALTHLKSRTVSTLSGGERQRVLLARALVQETQVILLDEPANHLDIKNKIEILKIIKQQNRDHGKTIIAVMHDPHDVRRSFDQVLFLKNGGCLFMGKVADGFKADTLNAVFEIEVPL